MIILYLELHIEMGGHSTECKNKIKWASINIHVNKYN